ncbi:nuclear transport factor 2 family protein [Ancylomarina sp. DW003]|nr:nuclear transport factor 2 family protein [Ancylomarina sp. DW003]MDE5424194.1 nuclear transport factor 2 family protein [Ancylomarina sp. DW003]
MLKKILFILALAISFSACQNQVKTTHKDVGVLIDNWHLAATNADIDSYFSALAENAIYIGTDASERWTKDEFYSFCKPYFAKGKAWDFKAFDRKIYFSEDGKTAWFNELLNTWMGVCRASGVLNMKDDEWKISHYQLSVTVKNENMKQFLEIK